MKLIDRDRPIALVGPTLTRPALSVIPRVPFCPDRMWSMNPGCRHYITYGHGGSGVRCIYCGGWYCA